MSNERKLGIGYIPIRILFGRWREKYIQVDGLTMNINEEISNYICGIFRYAVHMSPYITIFSVEFSILILSPRQI